MTTLRTTPELGQFFMRFMELVEEIEVRDDVKITFGDVCLAVSYDAYPLDGDGDEGPSASGVLCRQLGADHAQVGLLHAALRLTEKKSKP